MPWRGSQCIAAAWPIQAASITACSPETAFRGLMLGIILTMYPLAVDSISHISIRRRDKVPSANPMRARKNDVPRKRP